MCEWAEEAGMSLRSLARHFKKETGINLENWRRSALHQRAIELISKNRSVSDVALELGYESVSAFVYSFRNEYGLPPMQFLRSKKII
jgi:AraC-like DNA-binding protein